MAIVQMFGFDHIEPSGTTNIGIGGLNNTFAAEGIPLLTEQYITNQFLFALYKNRNWLQIGTAYSSNSGLDGRFGMTFKDWFGPNPDMKKCYLGFRLYNPGPVNQPASGHLLTYNNTRIFGFSELVLGEAYYEICIDPVANTIQRWVDGNPLTDVATAVLPDTTKLWLGFTQGPSYYQYGNLWFTDIYSVIDTGDDTPCTRLGAVRVAPLSTEDLVLPQDWSFIPPDYGSLTVSTETFRRPYPNFSATPYAGFDYTCTPGPRSGQATYHIYSPTSGVEFNVTRPTVPSPVIFTMKMAKPVKIGVVQQRRSSSTACFYPSAWTIEGSMDGVQWTVLDTRAVGTALVAASSIHNHVIPKANRGTYLYYRAVFTDANSIGAANYFQVAGLQFFADPDEVLITPGDLLDSDNSWDNARIDQTGGVVRTSITESEATIGIKKPVINGEKILKVQLKVSALRDGGSENRLIVNTRQGATQLPDYVYSLDTLIRHSVVVYEAHKAPDGTEWTADNIDALSLAFKSKTGAV